MLAGLKMALAWYCLWYIWSRLFYFNPHPENYINGHVPPSAAARVRDQGWVLKVSGRHAV